MQRNLFPRSHLTSPYTPKRSYISPGSKYNQRSLSASALHSHTHAHFYLHRSNSHTNFNSNLYLKNEHNHGSNSKGGSLREQIRLDAFKKTLIDSKLNKTAFNNAKTKLKM